MGDELDHGVYALMIVTPTFATIELRRYRLKPGRRDELIATFEAQFLETQEACGMVPIGHFRDLDDDDAFVWLRGFERFEDRAAALTSFYIESQAWQTHRDAANDTMIDSDDVLLLRPARAASGFDLRGFVRPPLADVEPEGRYLWLSAVMLELPMSEQSILTFEADALAPLREIADDVAYFVTEHRANEFPRLPVREGENAFVVGGLCASLDEIRRCGETIEKQFVPSLVEGVVSVEHFRLHPARRSLLR